MRLRLVFFGIGVGCLLLALLVLVTPLLAGTPFRWLAIPMSFASIVPAGFLYLVGCREPLVDTSGDLPALTVWSTMVCYLLPAVACFLMAAKGRTGATHSRPR
jgi:hypothetical protein